MPETKSRFRRIDAPARRGELITAAIECLSEGGMTAFTIDRISNRAGVSRGLINHHFRSKDDLLVAVYDQMTNFLTKPGSAPASAAGVIIGFIDANFDRSGFNIRAMPAWLAIWGEIVTNPRLKTLHTRRYGQYRKAIETAMHELAEIRQLQIDCNLQARTLVALIDGLWLEHCLNPRGCSLTTARTACIRQVEQTFGSITG